ncbi:peptidoglycan DD-metalloendopeptidase family protein [Fictibacillus sp. Mic-4]|uniref:murein hydrolase activator EnvC family protein n=1 Tax=Fictibacillus TaxID=1329200 RepID=UPI0004170A75|nr:M23 family metallopeptidase [Fictibacillus gelatini]
MNRKVLGVSLALSLFLSGIATYANYDTAHAESLKNIQKKKAANEKKQKAAKAKLKANEEDQAKAKEEIKKLDAETTKTNEKIHKKESEISKVKLKIGELENEIDVVQKRIDKRDKLLKERVSSMYESGGSVKYLDVVLGSKNFGDFIDRVFALNLIADQDRQILEEHKADKKLLEDKKLKLETALTSLQQKMDELKTLKNELEEKVKEKNKLMASLKKEHSQLEDDVEEFEHTADLLKAQEEAMKAEKIRAQMQAERGNVSHSSTGADAPDLGNGMLMKPASGVFSSGFGHRGSEFHAGVDIAARGTVPIYAAADGTVIRSYYSTSYGNCIFISHSIKGQVYTTVYAHMSSRVVNGGSVHRGQLIGYMGNTGASHGQHLHFELHKGPWNMAKSNAIDPRPYF